MSILDGMPSNEQQLNDALKFAEPIVNQAIEKMGLTERQQGVLKLMEEGLSLADILGITKQQRDALLAQGGRLLQVGDIEKARDVLIMLYQLEPLDERTIYLLAATYQAEGDFKSAARIYVLFIALDATNPLGFLRLGECFLGAKEYDNAEGMFEQAMKEGQRKNDAANVAHAEKMLSISRERRAASAA